ncbi:hypothetical protein FBY35_6690 [Streptomyces sp. SLBN-118]|uniref:hypothetical protein n=1 Tax=Streptomyces sp. SLBN-118 TaxID=2768454 RepID=UPI001151F757|nr:hypothetical protein [Streptomyces sp. SLBN-118]TQK45146.1 hypothetical protein FBY35_6690 [Streptomyces sp. SLBN-118]
MRRNSSGSCVRFRATAARSLGTLLVAVLVLALLPGVAQAHGEESDEAAVLVEQAIALIANDAGESRVAERIEDALMAPHKEGVDLKLVNDALKAVERPGAEEAALRETRKLLLASLGGKLPSAPKAGQLVTGTETGTSVVLDEFRPARGVADAADAALFALSLVAIAAGLWLSVRLRPRHSIRELRRRAAAEEHGEGRKQ